MSWDVALLRSEYSSVEAMPRDYRPASLGTKEALIGIVARLYPDLDSRDPSWWLLQGQGWSIEFNVGKEDPVDSITLHVRGSDEVLQTIRAICEALGTRALDYSSGEFLDFDHDPGASLRRWRDYAAQIRGRT